MYGNGMNVVQHAWCSNWPLTTFHEQISKSTMTSLGTFLTI